MSCYKSIYDVNYAAKRLLINETVSNKANLLTRKEAYNLLRECGDTILVLSKRNTYGKGFYYVVVMELYSDGEYIYSECYGRTAEKISYRAFNTYVSKCYYKNERAILIKDIPYREIEKISNDIIERENLNFDFKGFNVFGDNN